MKKSTIESGPRTLVNVLGIPGILTVVWLGEWWYLSFVWIVAILGTIELKKLVEHQGGQPFLGLMLLLVSATILNYKFRYISGETIILFTGIITFSIEIFRNQKKAFLNVSTVLFSTVWLGLMMGSLLPIRAIEKIGFELILQLINLNILLSIWIVMILTQ